MTLTFEQLRPYVMMEVARLQNDGYRVTVTCDPDWIEVRYRGLDGSEYVSSAFEEDKNNDRIVQFVQMARKNGKTVRELANCADRTRRVR